MLIISHVKAIILWNEACTLTYNSISNVLPWQFLRMFIFIKNTVFIIIYYISHLRPTVNIMMLSGYFLQISSNSIRFQGFSQNLIMEKCFSEH